MDASINCSEQTSTGLFFLNFLAFLCACFVWDIQKGWMRSSRKGGHTYDDIKKRAISV